MLTIKKLKLKITIFLIYELYFFYNGPSLILLEYKLISKIGEGTFSEVIKA